MNDVIAIIGLGYVGLPLAIEFSKKYRTFGFDLKESRVAELKKGFDRTLECDSEALKKSNIEYTVKLDDIKSANIYIVTVPTPIDDHCRPDLTPLLRASESVGKVLSKGDIVVYESTVYPGATEEVCVPVIEEHSGLIFNKDFFCGYSPERINPGDKLHTVTNITKVTSGSTPEAAEKVNNLYKSIISAGTHLAPSIKVAEAAKVIENAQRDINIAFVNELAIIFNRLDIDTASVLAAARTKWNFLPFVPGIVGGHCIGVDPYYLAHKAQEVGYHPEIILAGRRLNDNMGIYIANQLIKLMIKNGHTVKGAKVLIMGITFKENCPDTRNTRVIDIIRELEDYGCVIDVFDPMADVDEVRHEYNLELLPGISSLKNKHYDAVLFAVAHKDFFSLNIEEYINNNTVIYDLKGVLDRRVDGRL